MPDDGPLKREPTAAVPAGMLTPGYDERSLEDAFDVTVERRAVGKAVQSFAAEMAKRSGAKPFPVAAQQLMQLTAKQGFEIDEAVRIVESDPLLATQMLTQVNSAAYGRRTRCKSVHQAITLLGARAVQGLAMSIGVYSMFDELSAEPASRVVEHGATVGAIARIIAPLAGLHPDEMYTLGLLHDVGKLMLLNGNDLDYPDLLANNKDPDTIHLAERERFGFDHAVLAGHVLNAWGIPAPVPRVVSWHHQPQRAYRAGGSTSRLIAMLRVADRISYLLYEGVLGKGALAGDEALRYLGLSHEIIESMYRRPPRDDDGGSRRRAALEPETEKNDGGPPALPNAAFDPVSVRAPRSLREPAPKSRHEPGPRSVHAAGVPMSLRATAAVEAAAKAHNDFAAAQAARAEDAALASVRPCALCVDDADGASCPRCREHYCKRHEPAPGQLCRPCEAAYREYRRRHVLVPAVSFGVLSLFVIVLAVLFLRHSSSRPGAVVQALLVLGILAAAESAASLWLSRDFKRKRATFVAGQTSNRRNSTSGG